MSIQHAYAMAVAREIVMSGEDLFDALVKFYVDTAVGVSDARQDLQERAHV